MAEFRALSAVCGSNAASASGWRAGAEGDAATHFAEHDVVGQRFIGEARFRWLEGVNRLMLAFVSCELREEAECAWHWGSTYATIY